MHELGITQSILNIAVSEATKHNAKKVLNIKIKVGELSGVMPQLIQEYFNIISKDTIAEKAKLIIERVPIKVICSDCNSENVMDRMKYACPACNSINIKIISGREFYVDSLEVE
jgi:hydrogenase nickel incorporation protein HypA/HybF